jgi:hypothetical protein
VLSTHAHKSFYSDVVVAAASAEAMGGEGILWREWLSFRRSLIFDGKSKSQLGIRQCRGFLFLHCASYTGQTIQSGWHNDNEWYVQDTALR